MSWDVERSHHWQPIRAATSLPVRLVAFFRSTNDGDSWIDISGAVIPPGGNVRPLAIDSGWCALLELLVAA
jgi:hypothetical protein